MNIVNMNIVKETVRNKEGKQLVGVSREEKQALILKYETVLNLINEFGGYITPNNLQTLMANEKTPAGVNYILNRLYENKVLNTYTLTLNQVEEAIYDCRKFIVYAFTRQTRESISGIGKTQKPPSKKLIIWQNYLVNFLTQMYNRSVYNASEKAFNILPEEEKGRLLSKQYHSSLKTVSFNEYIANFNAYDQLSFKVGMSIYDFVEATKSYHTGLDYNRFNSNTAKRLDEISYEHRLEEEGINRFCLDEIKKVKQRLRNFKKNRMTVKLDKANRQLELLENSLKKSKLYSLRKVIIFDEGTKKYVSKQAEVLASFKDLKDWNMIIKSTTINHKGISITLALFDTCNRKLSARVTANKILNARYLIEALLEYYTESNHSRRVYVQFEIHSYKSYPLTHKEAVSKVLYDTMTYTDTDRISKGLKYIQVK